MPDCTRAAGCCSKRLTSVCINGSGQYAQGNPCIPKPSTRVEKDLINKFLENESMSVFSSILALILQRPLREAVMPVPRALGPPYYCAPLVSVPKFSRG